MKRANSNLRGMIAAALLVAFGPATLPATAADGTFSEAQRKEIEQIIRDYLFAHPEIISELQEAQRTSEFTQVLSENAAALYRSPHSFVAGNPDGDVTVVEFFDYNCGFCKRAFGALVKLIETDKNVRVVLKELPIFGKPSEAAARVAIAADKQGKYFEMHAALLNLRGQANEQSALGAAQKLGLDVERLKQDMNAPEVDAAIREALELAQNIGLEGTPFYLVGDRVIPGAPENLYDLFVARVADVRKNGCTIAC